LPTVPKRNSRAVAREHRRGLGQAVAWQTSNPAAKKNRSISADSAAPPAEKTFLGRRPRRGS